MTARVTPAGERRWSPHLGSVLVRIREARHRWYLSLLLSGLLGLIVGLSMAGIDTVISDGMLDPLRRAPLTVQVVVPATGLVVIAAVLKIFGRGAPPFVSDEYIRAYHDPAHPIDLAPAPARIVTGILTLGSGAAMGAEALGIYYGCVVSTVLSRRFKGLLSGENGRIFLVAGAAAGVAAVFKAPATGAVFALEVPYMQDMAAGAVLPALVAAAVAYLAVALTEGTSAIITVGTNPSFGVSELAGALVVGAACGLGARAFVTLMGRAKHVALDTPVWLRVLLVGGLLGGFAAATHAEYGHPFTLGAGYDVITWATDPRRGLWLIAGLLLLRVFATVGTQLGGGTGGTFVPLVVQGALLGRLVQGGLVEVGVTSARNGNLFVLVGMAAFLSAGYRVPLAAVMFVAETTGKPGFIVPGLLACAVAELVMGRRSASPYQQQMRAGHVERRFELPVQRVMREGGYTIPPDATVDDMLNVHAPAARARTIPVVDADGIYLGSIRLRDVERVPRADRPTTPVGGLLIDLPTADPAWPLRRALETMQDRDLQRISVIDDQRRYLGQLTLSDIVGFDELIGNHPRTAGDAVATEAVALDAASAVLQIPPEPEIDSGPETDTGPEIDVSGSDGAGTASGDGSGEER